MRLHRFLILVGALALLRMPVPAQEFKVTYVPPESEFGRTMEGFLKRTGFFNVMADGLNEIFILPRDLHIVVLEGDTATAFYSPDDHAVVICYELMAHLAQNFAGHTDTEEQLLAMTVGATLFVFLHELGHALIQELDLPTTGREEDAADEFATLLLIEAGDAGHGAALSAAAWFALESDRKQGGPRQFWDEHSLDEQRFYDILCRLHACNPGKFGQFVCDVPAVRLEKARRDMERKRRSWNRLLEPHIRKQL